MNAEEVRSKTDAELKFDKGNLQKELFELRFRSSTEANATPSRVRAVRRAIARINTVLHERTSGVRGQEPRN
ncbi:50S ribosomal protein L29 [Engelhardtia mirabilis]|uniref:Large ribosomal subunit protein uL29 n=1 Tax=Engelhardtia mirabilis TaxID=2528011 RepID=A0A518BPC3_9BACT|nr:50S ribosomal protein L29 [Planctomycetes bacterium Pla133]QDV03158.1 50S ribosomal protein L29 [Planctomycetes bacterium Pla86]